MGSGVEVVRLSEGNTYWHGFYQPAMLPKHLCSYTKPSPTHVLLYRAALTTQAETVPRFPPASDAGSSRRCLVGRRHLKAPSTRLSPLGASVRTRREVKGVRWC